jgi:hypothetical protein
MIGELHVHWFAPEEHDLNVRFVLSAVGQSSGKRAQTTFTDGVTVVSITSPTSSAPLRTNLASSPTISVGITYSTSGNSNATTSAVAALLRTGAPTINGTPTAVPTGTVSRRKFS